MPENSNPYCEVSLPVPLDRPFTYRLPETLRHRVQPGCRLLVPFGSRKLTGIVLRCHDQPAEGVTREAFRLVDEEPVFSEEMLALGRWIAGYYCAPLGEVLREFDQRPPGEIVRETLTVADKIAELVSALLEAKDRGLDFLAFLRRARSRRAAVVIFLALLELMRQGRVRLTQERPFGPVLVWAQTGIEHWGWPGRD